MAEVVVPNTQIEREPVRHFPVVLYECSSIKPPQDLIQVASQGRVGYLQRGTKLRKGLILGEVKKIGETESRPELRAGKLVVVVMPIDVNSGVDGVTAMRPSQHVMPAVVLMDPASRPPLAISGHTGDVDIGETLIAHCAGIESVGIATSETGIVQKTWREHVRPVEVGEKPVVRNLYTIDRTRIGLELVGVGPEPIEEEAIFRFINIVVEPDMPLIRVMGQAEWRRRCPESGQIGIVLKRRGFGIGTGLGCLELSHGDNTSGRRGPRGSLLEEYRRKISREILRDKLGELGCLDGRDQGCCIGGSQYKEAAKREQFVFDNRAAEGSAEFVSSKGRYCAAPCRPRGTELKLSSGRQRIIRVELRQRPV